MTDPFRHDDAAYVLGALDPADRDAFEAHLATCPACAARVAEIADLPALLSGIDRAQVLDAVLEETPALPDTVLPRLVREVRRERSRRRWYAVAGAAAAAAVAASITAAVVTASGGTSRGTAPAPHAVALRALVPTPVHATVALTAERWGTRITLRCRYAASSGPALRYDMDVYGRGGARFALGSWRIAGGEDVTYVSGAPVPPSAIARVDVTTSGGTPVLRLTR